MLSKMTNSFYNKIVLLYNNCHYVDQSMSYQSINLKTVFREVNKETTKLYPHKAGICHSVYPFLGVFPLTCSLGLWRVQTGSAGEAPAAGESPTPAAESRVLAV